MKCRQKAKGERQGTISNEPSRLFEKLGICLNGSLESCFLTYQHRVHFGVASLNLSME